MRVCVFPVCCLTGHTDSASLCGLRERQVGRDKAEQERRKTDRDRESERQRKEQEIANERDRLRERERDIQNDLLFIDVIKNGAKRTSEKKLSSLQKTGSFCPELPLLENVCIRIYTNYSYIGRVRCKMDYRIKNCWAVKEKLTILPRSSPIWKLNCISHFPEWKHDVTEDSIEQRASLALCDYIIFFKFFTGSFRTVAIRLSSRQLSIKLLQSISLIPWFS